MLGILQHQCNKHRTHWTLYQRLSTEVCKLCPKRSIFPGQTTNFDICIGWH